MSEMRDLSPANEDYLEAIYDLCGGGEGSVRSVDLAARLSVSAPSVNKAVAALKDKGFVLQPSYGGITLTPAGREYGKAVLERHRMLYRFLTDILGVEPTVAATEACEMEHAISDDTLKRWVSYLSSQGIVQSRDVI